MHFESLGIGAQLVLQCTSCRHHSANHLASAKAPNFLCKVACGTKDLDVKEHDLVEAVLADKNSLILLGQEKIESFGAIPAQVVCKYIGLGVDVCEGEDGVPDGHLVVHIPGTKGEEIILRSAKVDCSYHGLVIREK